MIRSITYINIIPALLALFLGGCYLEQGKLHFDKLNLNPITVYAMKPLETSIYCIAEGDFPSGEVLEQMHLQSLQQVESNPEEADWGELVCLALSDHATLKQMRETSNVLLLVLAARKDLRGAVRGFKKIIDQRVNQFREIENYQRNSESELAAKDNIIATFEEQLNREQQVVGEQREKISVLEQQVQKLKEVELLLQPNKTTNPQ